jgi:hypothetical protein
MSYSCPNENSKEWKMLVNQTGERLAHMAFVHNGYQMPDVRPITEIKKAIGWKTRTENFAGIARRIKLYNQKHGTSHSFDPKPIYGNTFELTLKLNYLPVNIEKQRRRLERIDNNFKVDVSHNTAFDTTYTPSKSEQEAGWFDDEGNFRPNADRVDDDLPSNFKESVSELFIKDSFAADIYKTLGYANYTKDVQSKLVAVEKLISLIKNKTTVLFKTSTYFDLIKTSEDRYFRFAEMQDPREISKKEFADQLKQFNGEVATTEEKNNFINSYLDHADVREKYLATQDILNQVTPAQKAEAQKLYSAYLDTIFPNSKVRDIVYHGTPYVFEEFDISKAGAERPEGHLKGISFTNDSDLAFRFADSYQDLVFMSKKEAQEQLEEAKKGLEDILSGKDTLFSDKPETERKHINYLRNLITGFEMKITGKVSPNIVAAVIDMKNPKIVSETAEVTEEELKSNEDGYIVKDTGDHPMLGFIEYVPKKGINEYIIPKTDQIHRLGNQKDIQQFKKYVDSLEAEYTDDLLPTAPLEIENVEKKRKAAIETDIRRERENLAKAKDTQDVELMKTSTVRLAKLKQKLEDPEKGALRRAALAGDLSAYEEVLTFADKQLKEIREIMSKENFRHEDLLYVQRTLNLWLTAGDFSVDPKDHPLLDEFEFQTEEIRAAFRKRRDTAEDLLSTLKQVQENYLGDFVRRYTEGTLTNEEIMQSLKDSPWLASRTLNVGRSEDPMVQAIFLAINEANIQAQQEAGEIWKELDKLTSKFLKASGGNFEILKQKTKDGKETGRLAHRFSEEFFTKRNELMYRAFRQYDIKKGELKKNPKAVKEFFEWTNRNTITFDVRLLFADENMEGGIIPEDFLYKPDDWTDPEGSKERHIQELKNHLGEKGYEWYIKRQEDKIKAFQVAREATYESIQSEMSDFSQEEKDAFFLEWLKEHSPYWNLEMAEKPNLRKRADDSFYQPKGIREYAEQVARKYTPDGTKTEWYDTNFEKIEANEDLFNYYSYVMKTLNEMRYILPENEQNLLGVGIIPTVKKTIMDQFTEKGVMMGVTPFWDKLKELQTTTDLSTKVTSDVDPRTGEIEKRINIPFIEDNNARISKIVEVKKIKYIQENGKSPDPKTLKEFRVEAKEELSKEKSWDITRIMKAHSLSVLAFKHKSYIEPQIRMLRQRMEERPEIVTNKAGEAKVIETKTGEKKQATQKGLSDLKNSLDYFLDTQFFNIGGRKVEGISKKKLYTKAEKIKKKELEALLEKEENEESKEKLQAQIDALGGYKTISGTGDAALKFMTLKGLGWNLMSGASNIGFGVISNLIQGSDGREYSMSNMRKAYMLVMNSMGRNLTFNAWEGVNGNALKIRTLMDQWDLLQTSNKELFDMTNKSTLSKLKRFGPYSIQERSEYLNIAPVMVAMMMEFKAKNADGEPVSIWDAYGSDGKLKEGFTAEDVNGEPFNETKMIQKIKRVVEMNHGDYNNALAVKATFAGRALSQFRTWMFEGFANRFEKEKRDYALSYGMSGTYIRKGRYRSYTKGQLTATGATLGTMFLPGIGTAIGTGAGYLAGRMFGMSTDENVFSDTIFTLKQLARKLAFQKTQFGEKFNEVDAANMRKNMTELYIMVTMMGIGLLLKGLSDDDDEKENMFAINLLLNQTTRMQTDIAFYTNPLEFEKLTKTAVPLAQLIQGVHKVGQDTFKLFNEDKEDDVFKSGPFKGESKLYIHSSELIPLSTAMIKLHRYGTTVFD